MIIGLHGQKGFGKSTVAQHLQAVSTRDWTVGMFAGKLKGMIAHLLGCTVQDLEDREFKEQIIPEFGVTPRYLMQTLGTEWGRSIKEDFWVQTLMREYQNMQAGPFKFNWIVSDVRFPNEAQAIRDAGGLLITITRQGIPMEDTHPSETALNSWDDWDYRIGNHGTLEQLKEEVIKMAAVLDL